MLELIRQLDTTFFLWLNSFHTLYFDWLMSIITAKETWIPLYLTIFYVIIRNRSSRAIFPIIGMVLVVSLCDFINHDYIKPMVGRLRPSHNPELQNIVHIFNEYRGGRYSFASSHAANSFGLAIFSSFLIKNWSYKIFIFLWAFINSYSRIYLGVHYPGDIIAGIFVALVISLIIFIVYKLMLKINIGNKELDTTNYKEVGLIIFIGFVIFFCIASFVYIIY